MELVFRPSRRAVNSALAKTSVGPGLLLQHSVCVHLCLISSALSVPARSLQKSLGLVIPLAATLHNICHDTAFRDPATSARALAFCLLPHAHAFPLLSLLLSFFAIFSTSKNSTALWSNSINVLPGHWSADNILARLAGERILQLAWKPKMI